MNQQWPNGKIERKMKYRTHCYSKSVVIRKLTLNLYLPCRLPSIDAQEISSRFKKLLSEHYMSSKLIKMLETLAEHSKDEKAIIFVGIIRS